MFLIWKWYTQERKIEPNFYNINTYEKTYEGDTIAILGLGSFYHLGKKVKEKLKEEMGINATLINPRYITGLDKEMLEELTENHQVVITLEDGILNGGFGEKIASFYGNKDMKVLNLEHIRNSLIECHLQNYMNVTT